jgi:hypothetical protein
MSFPSSLALVPLCATLDEFRGHVNGLPFSGYRASAFPSAIDKEAVRDQAVERLSNPPPMRLAFFVVVLH